MADADEMIPLRGAVVSLDADSEEIVLELGENSGSGTPQKPGGGAKIRLRLRSPDVEQLQAWFTALQDAIEETYSFHEDSALIEVSGRQVAEHHDASERYSEHSEALAQVPLPSSVHRTNRVTRVAQQVADLVVLNGGAAGG